MRERTDYVRLAVDAAILDSGIPLADLSPDEQEQLAIRAYDYLLAWDVLRVVDGRLLGGLRLREAG